MFYKYIYNSPIGKISLASDGENLIGLWLEGQRDILKDKDYLLKNDLPVFAKFEKWLNDYFAGKKPDIKNLPIKLQGSEFSVCVWQRLCQIEYGQTVSYGQIANYVKQKLGKQKMSAQAVGRAVGRNPIAIIIPCHRVVGASGKLTGYAGGLDLKIKLLKHENCDMSKLYI